MLSDMSPPILLHTLILQLSLLFGRQPSIVSPHKDTLEFSSLIFLSLHLATQIQGLQLS